MPPRKPAAKPAARSAPKAPAKAAPPKTLAERTPVAEWIAAGVGLVLTLGVVGFSLWEAVTVPDAPPQLTVALKAVHPVPAGGYVAEIEVRNASYATAADVEVTGVLETAGAAPEARRLTVVYVPGRGGARAGLMFDGDPAAGRLKLAAEAYVEP